MALSNRERTFAVAVAAVFGLFALDRLALSPYLQQREWLRTENQILTLKLSENRRVVQRQRAARTEWAGLQAAGLQSDASEVEGQMQHWLHLWAQEAGLGNLSLRADRTAAQQSGFVQVTVRATGTGPMSSVTKLLWRLEAAPVPLRITDVLLSPAREGSDQVQMQWNVSALCTAPESEGQPGANRLVATPAAVTGDRL